MSRKSFHILNPQIYPVKICHVLLSCTVMDYGATKGIALRHVDPDAGKRHQLHDRTLLRSTLDIKLENLHRSLLLLSRRRVGLIRFCTYHLPSSLSSNNGSTPESLNERYCYSVDLYAQRLASVTYVKDVVSGSWALQGVVSGAEDKRAELYIECALYIDGAPFGLPMRTRLNTTGPAYLWNELITLSSKYRDLTAHSQAAITVWDVSCRKDEGLIGSATILLFNSKMQMKSGKQNLRLWQGKEADGSFPTSTSGKVPRHERGEVERLKGGRSKELIGWTDLC
ncbi:unnamed protein product [Eruca vesicaria subsp. sativa]|uniref:C2 PI3K-type domain-containing protein n=1 Tax=Eruca vesicaria subsp. sativa TaxID=29727 RepID=A0ABC8L987_ERUVS|nr:unnamed protein product [Eruca vesicaria subsp. sativa]